MVASLFIPVPKGDQALPFHLGRPVNAGRDQTRKSLRMDQIRVIPGLRLWELTGSCWASDFG